METPPNITESLQQNIQSGCCRDPEMRKTNMIAWPICADIHFIKMKLDLMGVFVMS